MSYSSISEIIERAQLYSLNTENILRELFQRLVLYVLTIRNIEKYYIFQGGTAVRFIYKSPRFSLDLDFTVINRDFKTVGQDMNDIVKHLNKLLTHDSIPVIKTREKTSLKEGFYRCYLVFDTMSLLRRKIKIKLELLRGKYFFEPYRALLEIQYPFRSVFSILAKTKNQILADKIASLAGGFHRGYIRWRDLFDIYWLVRKNGARLEHDYFKKEFGSWVETVKDLQKLRDYLLTLLERNELDQTLRDIKLLLPDSLLRSDMLIEYISTTISVINEGLNMVKEK